MDVTFNPLFQQLLLSLPIFECSFLYINKETEEAQEEEEAEEEEEEAEEEEEEEEESQYNSIMTFSFRRLFR